MAPPFAASADFALDKPAGVPCPHLRLDFACGIHDRLRDRGFPGCAAFDCFGAGQHVTQVSFEGRTWRTEPALAPAMFAVFGVMRQLHELLWHLEEAATLAPAAPLHADVQRLQRLVDQHRSQEPEGLQTLDVAPLRAEVGALLERVSALVRRPGSGPSRARGRSLRGSDLIGRDLRGRDLTHADLRGAYLLGADLSAVDLDRADLLGADLRAADLRGARLAGSLFLTQPQLDAARGDAETTVPARLARPAHWARSPVGDEAQ